MRMPFLVTVTMGIATAIAAIAPAPALRLQVVEQAVPVGTTIVTAASGVSGAGVLGAVRFGPALIVDGAEIKLASSGGYADEAVWQAVAVDGTRISAIAGARGGAHGNVRWTVWTGTVSGVAEEPQPFETFGGWGMGQLVAVAYVAGAPVIVGTWQSEAAGFDIALWQRDSSGSWHRQAPDAAISSSTSTLVQPIAAAGMRGRLAVVGQVNDVADGVLAAAWLFTDGRWSRVELSAVPGSVAESVSCLADGCLVAGRTNGVAAAWLLTWEGHVARLAVPVRAVPDDAPVLAVEARAPYLVTMVAGQTAVLVDSGRGWRQAESGIVGRLVAAGNDGGRLVVVTEDAGRSRVWLVGG